MSHTPGPWKVYDQARVVATGSGMAPGIADCRSIALSMEEQQGNAAFIALAPEMLEALKRLTCLIFTVRNAYQDEGAKHLMSSESFRLAEDLIRQAEGK